MSRALPSRKPWPMKWIVLAVVLFIAGYTYLTLHFRKPGPAYQPYADMRNRANTGRLLAAGYQRVELLAQFPADGALPPNTAVPAPGGLPPGLKAVLVMPPLLPSQIVHAHAASTASTTSPYAIQFRCVTPDDKEQLAGVELYAKAGEIAITPRFERLAGGLQARTRDHRVTAIVPPGALKVGSYRVTLVGERESRAWLLQVR